jgi:hypothetical protein
VHRQLHGLLQDERGKRDQCSPRGSLILLAAEAAAETGHIHFNAVHGNPQHACDRALHGCRALGA